MSWLRIRRPRGRTVLVSALAALVVLLLVAGLVGVTAVRRPFPTYDGELALPGLSAPVTVHRDAHGIPHVYAETVEDLFRAQGFVHAQDRFWEMDLRRHVTSGRLSELFGSDQVEADAFLRTLGWRRVAEQEWDLVSDEVRRYLTAYAEGVDAWVEETGGPAATGRKALQYRVLGLRNSGYEVAPWDPVDTLAWLKAMAWDLRANLVSETDRALLLGAGLSQEQVDELYPTYPYQRHDPIIAHGTVVDGEFTTTLQVPAEDLIGVRETVAAVARAADRLPELLGTAGAGLGSNSWVVAGEHTDTGSPLLANDPHLGVSLPGIWHQLGLHCSCGYQVSGFSLAGVPGVIIGHNDRIAWGFTNLAHDVTDLYLERLDGDRYEVDGQWRALTVLEETIRVAGGGDVTIRVRSTHHGPLLSDASEDLAALAGSEADLTGCPAGRPGAGELGLSLAWTALTPGTTIEALFALNQAGGWEEFRAAAALFEVPAQNLVYADVDGNIGYQAPGRVPVRGAGDGRWPAPGWDPAYDWQESLPFEELPHLLNPDEGLIVTANQAPVGRPYQPWLGADWSYGYRSDRIHALLDEAMAAGPVGVADLARLQVDDRHGFAPVLVPALLAAPTSPPGGDQQAAHELLAQWAPGEPEQDCCRQPADGDPDTPRARSSAAAAYFNATWRQLLALLFDELPDDVPPDGGDRWFEVVRALLQEPESPWWDRVDTAEVETRDGILARALSAAYEELADAQGDDPADWRWGRMHTLALRDGTFGESGIAPVEALFNRGKVEVSGGRDAVDATSWDAGAGYQVTAWPSMRMVVDLSDFDQSVWIQPTGNSGHPFHDHYTDQLELWRTGDTLPWRWDSSTIEDDAVHTLTLRG